MYIANRFSVVAVVGGSVFVLEIRNLAGFQLQLKLICNKRYKFRIRRLSLGIADGIAEKSLECVQVSSVPGHFDGMADGTLHSGRGGLEGFCHLGVQYLGDGIHGLVSPLEGLPEVGNLEGFL